MANNRNQNPVFADTTGILAFTSGGVIYSAALVHTGAAASTAQIRDARGNVLGSFVTTAQNPSDRQLYPGGIGFQGNLTVSLNGGGVLFIGM